MDVINEVGKATITDLLANGKRFDERDFESYREIHVQKGVLTSAEGSALVRIGNTQVLAAVKFDVATPFPDRPEEGVLSTSAEFVPMASPMFEPGPPSEDAIELARVVDRGIRAGELLDLKSFFIEEGKVLGIYVDIYVLDHAGNLIDAAALASMAALMNTRMPKFVDGKLVRTGDDLKPLKLTGAVVTTTFAKVNGAMLMDPCLDEERGMDGRITIGTMDGKKIVAVQKAERAGFSVDEVNTAVGLALAKGRELIEILKKAD